SGILERLEQSNSRLAQQMHSSRRIGLAAGILVAIVAGWLVMRVSKLEHQLEQSVARSHTATASASGEDPGGLSATVPRTVVLIHPGPDASDSAKSAQAAGDSRTGQSGTPHGPDGGDRLIQRAQDLPL